MLRTKRQVGIRVIHFTGEPLGRVLTLPCPTDRLKALQASANTPSSIITTSSGQLFSGMLDYLDPAFGALVRPGAGSGMRSAHSAYEHDAVVVVI